MQNKNKWGVILSQRDKLILRDLFYSKGLSLEILTHRYFKGKHRSTVIKRLHRLYDGNYLIKKVIAKKSESQIVYTISPKGLDEIQDSLSGQLIRKEFQSSNLEHDLCLAKIFDRLLLARGLNEAKTENEIQSLIFGNNNASYEPFRRLNTDIFLSLIIQEKEYKIAVEFERTKKESDRWSKHLLNYHLEDSIDLVLYISNDQYIEKDLKKIEIDLANNFSEKIFFCTLNDFYKTKEMVNFTNTNGKSFTMIFHS